MGSESAIGKGGESSVLKVKASPSQNLFKKSPTGIKGLDEITAGGFPKGRLTLICGGPGCGKSLMATQFLVKGAVHYDEPGVYVSFEERPEEIIQNVASIGFDLAGLIAKKKIVLDYVHVERSEIEEIGEYDLGGLFVRLEEAIQAAGAKRVVIDTMETLFAGLSNAAVLRSEIRRLFRWLKDKGVTAVVTAEQNGAAFTRQGLEEYVSDCVILLDHRVKDELSTRRLRVVKYRGSEHGTNEYPFLIEEKGISVLPITSSLLDHPAPMDRISTGIAGLDEMLDGEGYFRGSTVLISGTAGTGKTSMAAHFASAVCRRGERCIYFTFEESVAQILRNMRSIGLNLGVWVKKGDLKFNAVRPTLSGLERHLVSVHKMIQEFAPIAVVIDPITNLTTVGQTMEVQLMLTRLIGFLKAKGITTLFTSLIGGGHVVAQSEVGISSLIDTWILLRDMESGGERNRVVEVLKSRGMAHSNQIREFYFSNRGIKLLDVYLGPTGVLTGSARIAQESRERSALLAQRQEVERKRRDALRKRRGLETQISALQAELDAEEQELRRLSEEEHQRFQQVLADRAALARSRKADPSSNGIKAEKSRS
ncbi:circadian clock protein KaiC [Candidatus Manganitrophus noduliformans]|uniref:Circadian clock protein KaiC n=1 Tax=Candidatus Manganitrophus noduliformans TaxID=2606439 RepID=A0A7X6DTX4_9BACT|nr:circadian clock protein KaiC [Candidatus Manganitrophus noduliformans]NKE73321.1 circadian clock protein KaiC [Candidatus Manganitrophus noduliformans]